MASYFNSLWFVRLMRNPVISQSDAKMPRNWHTTLFLPTQGGSQPEVVIYSALPGKFEPLSLDNHTPSDPVWYKSAESSRQKMSGTRLTLMKIRQMQNREKERTREAMEEESLTNALAAINIDSKSNYTQESSAPADSLTSTLESQHGKAGSAYVVSPVVTDFFSSFFADTQAFMDIVLKPDACSSLGDYIPNASSERRSGQGMPISAPRTFDLPFPSQHEGAGIIIPTSIVGRQPRAKGVHRVCSSS
ncbi:hypothetical protein EDD18DRAFT_742094 [Armillaria luteobubalina]|uniref:Uncharacterized protein n=1 Tax=Armillaria luteobubalina TaxID=153913 RepID=A0AA39UX88_9AGAR|nr:hypothetical protein EDD18DRAFT_742094 [Armillaria luteobubalina]